MLNSLQKGQTQAPQLDLKPDVVVLVKEYLVASDVISPSLCDFWGVT
jgi:hypothetical protein